MPPARAAAAFVTIAFAIASCSSAPKVSRVDAATATDLSGYWNDTDVRIVCNALIDDCINSPRVKQAINSRPGRMPVVIVGSFKNDSDEHIDTSIISRTMETVIFNSGVLDFVASGAGRDELRQERVDQNSGNAREDTAAKIGNETGADFMLTGSVKTIVDRAGNQTVRTYFVDAQMSDISTSQRIWMAQDSGIKKIIVQPKVKL
jgi:uncharacterized protein (TIGR02722 family)